MGGLLPNFESSFFFFGKLTLKVMYLALKL